MIAETNELLERIDAQREGRELLERCALLPALEREAVELVDLTGLQPKEAARVLGVSASYQVLQVVHGGTIAPQWILGAFLGAGGFAGSDLGARLQARLPERNLRRLLGLIACLVAARYIQTAAATSTSQRPQPAGHAHPA
jgi:hypothetical protein